MSRMSSVSGLVLSLVYLVGFEFQMTTLKIEEFGSLLLSPFDLKCKFLTADFELPGPTSSGPDP